MKRTSFTQYILRRHGVIANAVDIVIFTVKNKQLKVLLIRRANKPFEDCWAIPGGFINKGEVLDKAAFRELAQETGVKKNVYLEQLFTFSKPKRDPRGRVISTVYFALINEKLLKIRAASDAKEAALFSVTRLPKVLAFDHREIFQYTFGKLKEKIICTNIVWSLLPKYFTLTHLQTVYEAILEKKLDKRNFRRKIRQLGLVRPIRKRLLGPHRPAQLHRFFSRKPQQLIEIF